MRIDIAQMVKEGKINGIKPNYSKIARQYNCNPNTVKRYYLNLPYCVLLWSTIVLILSNNISLGTPPKYLKLFTPLKNSWLTSISRKH